MLLHLEKLMFSRHLVDSHLAGHIDKDKMYTNLFSRAKRGREQSILRPYDATSINITNDRQYKCNLLGNIVKF